MTGIELGLGLGLDVRVAGVAVERADRLQVLHELGAVEVVAALRADQLAERAAPAERLDLLAVGVALVDLELADLEARALVDEERDLDALAIGREHDARRADLHVHVALVVIKGVQEEDVALEDVLAVRAAGAEGEEAALARSASRRGARRPGRCSCR